MTLAPRRYWYEPRGLLFVLISVAVIVWRILSGGETQHAPELLEEGIHTVRRVVDGDTLLLESGARVRLQGIDTPETVAEHRPVEAWGPEAAAFTKQFVAAADHKVRLTFGLERKDRHERFLAFVWHGDTMLNEELVRAGLAHARMDYRYAQPMKRRLAAAQDEARKAGRGIWSNADSAIGGGAAKVSF